MGDSKYTFSECTGSTMPVMTYGSICLVPSERQNFFYYKLPPASYWAKKNWFVFFVFVLVVLLVVAGIGFQCTRWHRRIRNRHERELRDKRVDGMLRMMSNSYQISSDRKAEAEVKSASRQRREESVGRGEAFGWHSDSASSSDEAERRHA
ncbi:hypothetical protein NESM_000854000 [Novymonas esmeraldas]|uniref:Uncharacterized protein n=1 Tax=Novymonas esmeraldas TaxID=1808958 RepID=A0AAW0F0M4_9TRYP